MEAKIHSTDEQPPLALALALIPCKPKSACLIVILAATLSVALAEGVRQLLACPPPPPNTGFSKHGAPCFRILEFFLEPSFFGFQSNPIENLVCSFVQAAGRVIMGGKVLVLP